MGKALQYLSEPKSTLYIIMLLVSCHQSTFSVIAKQATIKIGWVCRYEKSYLIHYTWPWSGIVEIANVCIYLFIIYLLFAFHSFIVSKIAYFDIFIGFNFNFGINNYRAYIFLISHLRNHGSTRFWIFSHFLFRPAHMAMSPVRQKIRKSFYSLSCKSELSEVFNYISVKL